VRFLAYEDLKNFGITHSKIHLGRLEKDNKFPKRVMVGANRVAWVEAEIFAWMEARVAERDNPEAPRHRLHGVSPNEGKGRERGSRNRAAKSLPPPLNRSWGRHRWNGGGPFCRVPARWSGRRCRSHA
jgi:prophage regulatory protein